MSTLFGSPFDEGVDVPTDDGSQPNYKPGFGRVEGTDIPSDPGYVFPSWPYGHPSTKPGPSGRIPGRTPGDPSRSDEPTIPNLATNSPVYAMVERLLRNYGLESLLPKVRAWMEDGLSQDEITIKMEDTDEFKARFPAMEVRRKAGLTPMSPAQYIEYENTARQLMRSSGLPKGFYDSNSDFTDLIAGDVSAAELQSRVQDGYRRVAQMAPEIKAAFFSYFGANGEDALAAYYLDPDKALPLLEQQTVEAEIGGSGLRRGFSIAEGMARELYGVGVDQSAADSALDELQKGRALFSETVEDTVDLRAEEEGLKASFGLDANSNEAITKRRAEREAKFAGSGGALAGQKGFSGAGAAPSQ